MNQLHYQNNHLYRFAWKNREIPQGSYVRLVNVGKLNSVEVELYDGSEKRFITDRRARSLGFVDPIRFLGAVHAGKALTGPGPRKGIGETVS